ncbi:MAG: hypothetical protein A2Y25_10410 [Candidatus Melainabacteria bacterium GWF2_37_15]|nr:MAG: hypothetical protein A2Y25_10410 [Candidatus Melainabacteria bacterium GWF2_37_15]
MINTINSAGKNVSFGTLRLTGYKCQEECPLNDLFNDEETNECFIKEDVGDAIYITSYEDNEMLAEQEELELKKKITGNCLICDHNLMQECTGMKIDHLDPGSEAEEVLRWHDNRTIGHA